MRPTDPVRPMCAPHAALPSRTTVELCHAPLTSLQVQSEAGFLYDSSINEHWTKDGMWPTSKDGGNRLWPYTFDNGIPQVGCTHGGSTHAHPLHPVQVETEKSRGRQMLAWQGSPAGSAVALAVVRSPGPSTREPRHHPIPCRALLPQICDATGPDGSCTKDEKYRGLWEVPVWVLQVRRGEQGAVPGCAWQH